MLNAHDLLQRSVSPWVWVTKAITRLTRAYILPGWPWGADKRLVLTMEMSLTSTEERVWAGSWPASGQLMPRVVASHFVQRDADRFPWSAREKLQPAA